MTDLFKTVPIRSSEITPKDTYLSRRDFMKAATIATGAALLTACAPSVAEKSQNAESVPTSSMTDELGDPPARGLLKWAAWSIIPKHLALKTC
jgi:hypothetical protein